MNPGDLSKKATPEDLARHKMHVAKFMVTPEGTKVDKSAQDKAASLEFLRGVDNALAASFSLRLQNFIEQQKDPKDSKNSKESKDGSAASSSASASCMSGPPSASASCSPGLAVFCLDECSVGWSALYYLMFKQKANVVGLRDPAHRSNNDFKLIAKHAGLWQTVVSCVLVFNLAHGPWGSGRWWNTARAAATSYSNKSQGCILARFLGSRILKENGASGQIDAAIPQLLADSIRNKGPKVALTRWMSWLTAAQIHMKHWWSRLLVLLVTGIEMKYFNNAEQFAVFDLKKNGTRSNRAQKMRMLCRTVQQLSNQRRFDNSKEMPETTFTQLV